MSVKLTETQLVMMSAAAQRKDCCLFNDQGRGSQQSQRQTREAWFGRRDRGETWSAANKALNDEFLRSAIEYKRDWDQELARRRRVGIQLPDPIPHPDDIIVGMKTGQVRINGPMTKEDKAEWDRMWDHVEECDRSIREVTADLNRSGNS
jgi:hypothetical protein